MVLIRNISKNNGIFKMDSYVSDWRSFWEDAEITSYKDSAGKHAY